MTIYFYKNDLPSSFKADKILAIDTETMGLNSLRDRLCLIQISNGDGDAYLVQFEKDNFDAPNLKKILNDSSILKLFHFARFDIAAINHYLNLDIKNIYCTKIASRLARTYTDKHGLKYLCEELLSIKISKQQQSSNWGADEISEDQKEYAANDVLYLHQLKDTLDEMLAKENRTDLAQECFDFLPTRAKLDLNGWNEIDIFAH